MILFTKQGCDKCEMIKNEFDLDELGVVVEELGPTNAQALADLAWYELVAAAQRTLPILVTDTEEPLIGALRIRSFLAETEPRH